MTIYTQINQCNIPFDKIMFRGEHIPYGSTLFIPYIITIYTYINMLTSHLSTITIKIYQCESQIKTIYAAIPSIKPYHHFITDHIPRTTLLNNIFFSITIITFTKPYYHIAIKPKTFHQRKIRYYFYLSFPNLRHLQFGNSKTKIFSLVRIKDVK